MTKDEFDEIWAVMMSEAMEHPKTNDYLRFAIDVLQKWMLEVLEDGDFRHFPLLRKNSASVETKKDQVKMLYALLDMVVVLANGQAWVEEAKK